MAKIKTPAANSGKHIKVPEVINYDARPPVFSFERVQPGRFCFSELDQEGKAAVAEAVFKPRTLPWSEMMNTHRHGLGLEKISKSSINPTLPQFIKEDLTNFLALRFHGKKPMVGYRVQDIFYVLWFDNNFTLYDH